MSPTESGADTARRVTLSADKLIERLRGPLHTVGEARRPPTEGGLPERAGLYAWWMTPGAIRNLKGPRHLTEPLELLYVGIAPKDARSSATLRSRIRGQHLGGNIGSSTFRQSLAALLFEEFGWTTRWSGSRTQLSPDDNRALSVWQRDYLRLAWAEQREPWTTEGRIISLMQPPLNLAGNASHPLYRQLKAHRLRLRSSASPPDEESRHVAREEPLRPPTGVAQASARSSQAAADHHRTQRVTAKDIEAGQVRIPRGAKVLLPRDRQDVTVLLRGRELASRWDPRHGPPERSGVIRVGRTAARELLKPGDVLTVSSRAGQIELTWESNRPLSSGYT